MNVSKEGIVICLCMLPVCFSACELHPRERAQRATRDGASNIYSRNPFTVSNQGNRRQGHTEALIWYLKVCIACPTALVSGRPRAALGCFVTVEPWPQPLPLDTAPEIGMRSHSTRSGIQLDLASTQFDTHACPTVARLEQSLRRCPSRRRYFFMGDRQI